MSGLPAGLGVVLLLFLAALVALPALFRVLWNSTMPELFGMKAMTYNQAFKLLVMAWIVFGVLRLG